MKRVSFLAIILFCLSCIDEEGAGTVKEKTFLRYLGTDQNDVAIVAEEDVNGGFILLSTYEIETGVTGQVLYKAHLTKLDQWGNESWNFTFLEDYVAVDDTNPNTVTGEAYRPNIKPAAFIQTNSGYLIIGDSIKADGSSRLQLILVDSEGTLETQKTISLIDPVTKVERPLHGRAITQDGNDFIVLGTIENSTTNMFVAKVSGADLSTIIWSREYGDGPTALINRLYLKSNQNYWGGSVLFQGSYDYRLIRATVNTQSTDSNIPEGHRDFNETALDFCQAPTGGWMITGYTNEGSAGFNAANTDDIFVVRVNDNGEVDPLRPKLQIGEGELTNDRGVSICATSDQGYVVLATVETETQKEDLMITKVNESCVEAWKGKRKYFGGADKQEGASVRETSDGSLLVFGTTYFGNEKKLMIVKVDKNGEL